MSALWTPNGRQGGNGQMRGGQVGLALTDGIQVDSVLQDGFRNGGELIDHLVCWISRVDGDVDVAGGVAGGVKHFLRVGL